MIEDFNRSVQLGNGTAIERSLERKHQVEGFMGIYIIN